ncbi:N-acetyl-gamma-glutamyl-phosphate reductase [Elusimicrobiota bacterium]
MNKRLKVSIIGATGFTGRELLRILVKHPNVEVGDLYSVSYHGKRIEDLHPVIKGSISRELKNPETEELAGDSDAVFLALPHTKGFKYVKSLHGKTGVIIDLSADYRFKDPEEYEKWYEVDHADRENLINSVYGIPEINRNDIPNKTIIANPGCYATSVILGLYPLLKERLIENSVYVDAKSGISGAGKKLDDLYLFYNRSENLTPYNVNNHRHMGEILCFLEEQTGKNISDSFSFCPQLLPLDRGILSNIYTKLNEKISSSELMEIFSKYYADERFINLKAPGDYPDIKEVSNTNNCAISAISNEKTGDVIIFSALDNLIKGAAGQAVQNMNLVLGLPEGAGFN